MRRNVGAMKDFLIPALFGTFPSPITSMLNMPALPAPDGNANLAFDFKIACDDGASNDFVSIYRTLMMAGQMLSQVVSDIKSLLTVRLSI
jgi:hypothetical protein